MEDLLSNNRLPKHIAVIMDGNGRWAQTRHLPRTQGHLEGVKRVEEIISKAREIGIKVLTLYTFSTENWLRPSGEVSMLMKTLISVLNRNKQKLMEGNIRFQYVGRREGIPKEVLDVIESTKEITKNNSGLVLNLAFNYGSRLEIVDAAKKIARNVQENKLKLEDINEEVFSQSLYTKELPDPDLLIRTSGEIRISNFLLWQLSYAELYFTDKFWPEFTPEELMKAIEDYQHRERRYGSISAS